MTYASGNPILASDFNSLKDTFNVLWGPRTSFSPMPDWSYYSYPSYTVIPANHPTNGPRGYGQTAIPAVSPGEIKASDWASLIDSLKATLEHQGTPYTPMTTPAKGGVITANPSVVEANFNLANHIDNIYSGSIATADLYTGTSPLSFNTLHSIDGVVDFGSYASACNFFAAGGQIDLYATTPGPLAPVTERMGRIRIPGAGYGSAARSQKIDGVVYTGMTYLSGAPTRAWDLYNFWSMRTADLPGVEFYAVVQQFNTPGSVPYPPYNNLGGPTYGACSISLNHPSNGVITYRFRLEYDRLYAARTPGVFGVDTPAGTTFNIVIRNPTTSALFKKTWNTPAVSFAYRKDPDTPWEQETITIANHFWDNRNKFIRYPHSTPSLTDSSYPPVDGVQAGAAGTNPAYPTNSNHEIYYNNNYNFRGRNFFTNQYYFNNSSLTPVSSFFTIISAHIGSVEDPTLNWSGIYSTSCAGGSLIYSSANRWLTGDGGQTAGYNTTGGGYGLSWKIEQYQGSVQNLTSASTTGVHYYDKGGSWIYMWVIPGKWIVETETPNFNPATYSVNLYAGEMHLTLQELGGNYRQEIPPPGYPNPSSLKDASVNHWWYNGAAAQIAVNTTNSVVDLNWKNMVDGYGNSTFPAQTPRVALKLKRGY